MNDLQFLTERERQMMMVHIWLGWLGRNQPVMLLWTFACLYRFTFDPTLRSTK
jgi:hypothetical protein